MPSAEFLRTHAYMMCDTCSDYIRRRITVIAPHLARQSFATGIPAMDLLHTYRQKVHDRHLDGESIATPDQTKPELERVPWRRMAAGVESRASKWTRQQERGDG